MAVDRAAAVPRLRIACAARIAIGLAAGALLWNAFNAAGSAAAVTRVLFIGNSLTTVNDVPGLVARLAAASNVPFEHRTVAFDGYSLEDHWNRGDARRAIGEGGWSTVVLQQGPSALPESRVLLRDYVKRFDAEARRVNARTALYMVWPASDRRADFDGVGASYAAAAEDVGGLLLPVGAAWREAWRRDSRLRLYGPDGFHPTVEGSYLAAVVIYAVLFHRPAVGLPYFNSSPADGRVLQQAAAAVAGAPGGPPPR